MLVTIFGILAVCLIESYKADSWYSGQSRHILMDKPDQAESLAVEWLLERGFTEIPDTGPLGTPRFGRYIIDGVPAHRYFVQQRGGFSSPLYFRLLVAEFRPPARPGAPIPKMSLSVGFMIGYYDIWPWEVSFYRRACRELATDFDEWVETDLQHNLNIDLSATAISELKGGSQSGGIDE